MLGLGAIGLGVGWGGAGCSGCHDLGSGGCCAGQQALGLCVSRHRTTDAISRQAASNADRTDWAAYSSVASGEML